MLPRTCATIPERSLYKAGNLTVYFTACSLSSHHIYSNQIILLFPINHADITDQTFYLPDGLVGRIDVLERSDEHESVFGEYHYIVKEIKLAKNIMDYHRLQTAYYTYIIGKIQEYTPDHYIVINRDRDELPFRR